MTSDVVLLSLAAVGLLLLAAVFSAAETAVQRVTNAQVDDAMRSRPALGGALATLVGSRPRVVSTSLLLSTLLTMSAAGLVFVAVDRAGGWSTAATALASALIMTVGSFVIVGVAGRTLGRQHAPAISRAMARPLNWLSRVLSPIATALIFLGNALTPGRGFREGPFDSAEELRELIDQAEAAEVIEDEERQMIHSVIGLGDTVAREVMVPRTEVVFIEATRTLGQALSLFLRSGFSRIPVMGESPDDVVGIVYLKDVTRRIFEFRGAETGERVESVMRPGYFVPDSKDADDLLREMQANRVHVAIVVDEFGGTAGLVTIEDILEEIVGEITDEYDTGTPEVEALEDGSLRISARLNVEDFAEELGISLDGDVEGVESVGGLLARRLGKVPIPGARVVEQGWELVAESAEGRRRRIGTIICRPVAQSPQEEEPE